MNMTEEPVPIIEQTTSSGFWAHHRLVLLLVATITISLVLTCVSVIIYATSGAAQLDLSRPGYRSVSDQVITKDAIDTYKRTGYQRVYGVIR